MADRAVNQDGKVVYDLNGLDYSNFCSDNLKGLKLVELGLCKFYSNVDEKKHLFYCVLPYDRDCEHKPKIKLDFSNNYELYHKINGYYRDYQRNNAPATILVLGEFKNYECIIRSEKQIVTIKKPKY